MVEGLKLWLICHYKQIEVCLKINNYKIYLVKKISRRACI